MAEANSELEIRNLESFVAQPHALAEQPNLDDQDDLDEEEASRMAEEEEKERLRAEEARQQIEEEASRKAEEEEKERLRAEEARQEAEEEERLPAEEYARQRADEEGRRKAEEEEKERLPAEDEDEEEAKRRAERLRADTEASTPSPTTPSLTTVSPTETSAHHPTEAKQSTLTALPEDTLAKPRSSVLAAQAALRAANDAVMRSRKSQPLSREAIDAALLDAGTEQNVASDVEPPNSCDVDHGSQGQLKRPEVEPLVRTTKTTTVATVAQPAGEGVRRAVLPSATMSKALLHSDLARIASRLRVARTLEEEHTRMEGRNQRVAQHLQQECRAWRAETASIELRVHELGKQVEALQSRHPSAK